MSNDQIQDLINNEIAASEIMPENYRADGRPSVESIRAQPDAILAEINGLGNVEVDAIGDIYTAEEALSLHPSHKLDA